MSWRQLPEADLRLSARTGPNAGMRSVIPLAECTDYASEAGGKATGLGALIAQGFPVPPGFCVTTAAYRAAVQSGGLKDQIQRLIAKASFRTDNTETSAAVADLFAALELPQEIDTAIREAYAVLGDAVHVAVRSSATTEDQAGASFAGQQDTYLYVQGDDAVVQHVVRCWASLFSPQAIGYRSRFGVDVEDLAMAVVVQVMVPAQAAGVMMTLNPVTGDRSTIVVEATYGLGEGVVRGDVGVDRFELARDGLAVVGKHIATKKQAHRFVETVGTVSLVDVDPDAQTEPALSMNELRSLGHLGVTIERAFARPMDIEWALGPGPSGGRELYLLQARPETVWSQRKPKPPRGEATDQPQPPFDPFDEWDPLHTWSDPDTHWSTAPLAELVPGVMSPLGWALWSSTEDALRGALGSIGRLVDEERSVPLRQHNWWVRPFYGRIAWQVNVLAQLAPRMPETPAEALPRCWMVSHPEGPTRRTRRLSPQLAFSYPRAAATALRVARAVSQEAVRRHRTSMERAEAMDLDEARRTVRESRDLLGRVLTAQAVVSFAIVQPVLGALEALARHTGDLSILRSSGGELALVNDLWETSRGRLTLQQMLLRHGHHGPQEGEVSSRVWREDPAPLQRLVDLYAALSNADSPTRRAAISMHRRTQTIEELLAGLSAWQRPGARLLLTLARRHLPVGDECADAAVRAVDSCRAAARRAGWMLAQEGAIADPDDVFLLSVRELGGALPMDVRDLISRRRERRSAYAELWMPGAWQGMPSVSSTSADQVPAPDADHMALIGLGMSPGIVEGRARVITDGDLSRVERGDVLVSAAACLSWVPALFPCAALVLDGGSPTCPAVLAASDLGLPCVVATRCATTTLRTGDRVSVDASSGVVSVLERCAVPTGTEAL